MNTIADLPIRWRQLITQPDAALLAELVRAPKRQVTGKGPRAAAGRFALPDHLLVLERQLAGQPRILLCHAALIVLIRREVALPGVLDRFFALWEGHVDFLLAHLSLRWMISAADTFADHGRTDAEKVSGLAAALFVNTIKLYETERHFLMDIPVTDGLQDMTLPPFDLDGVTPFRSDGDTLGNMFRRKDRVVAGVGVAGRLLGRVMQRAGELDTAYARFRAIHTSKGHKW